MSVTQGTWDTGEQIRDHKLAASIINFHKTPDGVFADEYLAELRDFTFDRSVSSRDKFLSERGYLDDANPEYHGKKAASQGSLHGYLIARWGTDDPAFDERDWELLEEWFKKGMPAGENVQR